MNAAEKIELIRLLEEKDRRDKAEKVITAVKGLTREQANTLFFEVEQDDNKAAIKRLCEGNLFYLLSRACKRIDIDRDWLFERCLEVQESPDGHLDLWAREHYKSTIITFGKSIQDILNDPNITIGIFSHTRPIAKAFLKQIKTEFEQNVFLKDLFPDILYSDPKKQAVKWSENEGLRVKRDSNPKDETVEAWGLVDGQPTGKHFKLLIYDDVVTRESVTTTDQIKKTTDALSLSYSLGADGGTRRFIGTRYHMNDTYKTIMDRGTAKARLHPATRNGEMDGEPVLMSAETLAEKRRDFGPYIYSTQMLQNPVADKAMSFSKNWLKYYSTLGDTSKWNKYLLVDPASAKKETNDYTVMVIIALAPDNNYYLLDGIRDRLNLTQRAKKLFDLHRQYQPRSVGYEHYGMQADIEHMEDRMERDNYRFDITKLGGATPKVDRIKKLVPIFEQARFWLPKEILFTDYEDKNVDFVKSFVDDEYLSFPVAIHDDMMDCVARILDPVLDSQFPKLIKPVITEQRIYNPGGANTGWMG